MRTLFLVMILLLGTIGSAQQASYTYINQPPPYSNPKTPWLVMWGKPKIGSVLQMQAMRSHEPQPGYRAYDSFLLIGASNPHVDMGRLLGPVANGFLFCSGEVVLHVGPPTSFVTHRIYNLPIPNSPSLVGASFYQQVVLNRFSSLSFSRGSHLIIGF